METQNEYKLGRLLTAVVAVVCTVVGTWLYFAYPDTDHYSGMLNRIGLVTGVIWLAFKELSALRSRVPTAILGLGLLGLGVMAARPKMGSVVIGLLTITIGVSATLKWMAKVADNAPKRTKRKK